MFDQYSFFVLNMYASFRIPYRSMKCLNLNPIMHESSDQMIWVS